jgi:hypothetical protein
VVGYLADAAADLEAAAAEQDVTCLTALACDVLSQRVPGPAVAAATAVLAAAAEVQEPVVNGGADIWSDLEAIAALQSPGDRGGPAAAATPRVRRRAAHYRWTGEQLLRLMAGLELVREARVGTPHPLSGPSWGAAHPGASAAGLLVAQHE